MLTLMLCLVLGATSLPTRPNLVDYGQVKSGVFVWIGGHTLVGQLNFSADPELGQIYVVDSAGQKYPMFIDEPVKLEIDSVKVDRLAPGLLNPAAAHRREQILRRLVAINDSLTALGKSPNDVANNLRDVLQSRPEIEKVQVNGPSVSYYWRGWSVASSYTAGRRLPLISPTAQFRSYSESLMAHLKIGEMVVLGYNGMYTVVPARKIGLFRAEIERLRLGQQAEPKLLTNKLVSGPIQLRHQVGQWLKQANRGE